MGNVGSDLPEVWGGGRKPQAVQAGGGRGSRVREARNELYAMVHSCTSCRESGQKYGWRGRECGMALAYPFKLARLVLKTRRSLRKRQWDSYIAVRSRQPTKRGEERNYLLAVPDLWNAIAVNDRNQCFPQGSRDCGLPTILPLAGCEVGSQTIIACEGQKENKHSPRLAPLYTGVQFKERHVFYPDSVRYDRAPANHRKLFQKNLKKRCRQSLQLSGGFGLRQ